MLTAALAVQLASLGLVRYPPTGPGAGLPAYLELMPDAPDDTVVIYPRAGFPSDDLDDYSMPELQVIVRASKATGARGYSTAEQIRRAITRAKHMGGTATYPTVWAQSTQNAAYVLRAEANEPQPVALGADQNGRLRWSVSWQLETLTSEVAA